MKDVKEKKVEPFQIADIVYTTPEEADFTTIPNRIIRDKNLSWKATAILIFFFSNRGGWKTYRKKLAEAKTDGKTAVANALKELEACGYVLQLRYRHKKTKRIVGSFFACTKIPNSHDLSAVITELEKHNLELQLPDNVKHKPQTGNLAEANLVEANRQLKILTNKNTKKEESFSCGSEEPPQGEEDIKNNDLLNKKITPSLFEKFWNCYPKERRAHKGKAKTSWEKICRKPNKDKPTWLQIKKALFEQKQTGQWQDPNYIPNPTTWLNQQRWLDDPAKMKGHNSSVKKPSQTSPQQIVESYFPVKGGRREIMLALWKRVDNIGTGVEENKQSQTVQQMCELVKWYEKSRNKRVEEIYVVPTLLGLLEKYVAYLEEENWIDQPGPNLFLPTGKVFKTFFYKIQRDIGVDFLTGSSYR